MRRHNQGALLICLILFSLIPEYESRRGGGGIGRSGGSRSGGGFGSRGSSAARSSSGGGIFGGSKTSGARNEYSRGTNFGGGANYPRQNPSSGGGINQKPVSGGGGWSNSGGSSGQYRAPSSQNKGGFLGGIFGSRKTHNSGGYYGGGNRRWNPSGMGSRSRGSQFKNMIVGAAAGYLTYQAGKALIRSATGPMMWNSRPYYWGSNYYRASPGRTQQCSMPIDPTDQQFGNVYFEDNTRPREIVWGCGHYEHCCGYECCRGGGAGDSIGGRGTSSIGLLLFIAILGFCAFPFVTNWVRRRRFGAQA